ncbi:MAG: polysaccharide biosynthesis C-terminal domain-containing protein, partial [Pseudomonadota bacterium]
ALNTVLGAGLFVWFRSMGDPGFPGLAIATSIAAWINAALLFFGLKQRGWYRPGPRLATRLLSVTLASLTMGAALLFVLNQQAQLEAFIPFGKFVETLAFILFGMLAYAVAALVFRAVRLSDLRAALATKS